MPIPHLRHQASSDAGERLPMLERELAAVRRELESLRAGAEGADRAHRDLLTLGMAALAILLALVALLRHG